MNPKGYPTRLHISYMKLGHGSWVCRVLNFFNSIVVTHRGRTKDEVRDMCCKSKDELFQKEQAARKRLQRQPADGTWQGFYKRPSRHKLA